MKSEKQNRLEIKKSDVKAHLTKEQQTFNKLTEKIHKLQEKKISQNDQLEKLLQKYTDMVSPLEAISIDHKVNLVFLIDEKANLQKLPKKLNHEVIEIIIGLMDEISMSRAPDEKFSELYEKYNGSSEDEDMEDEDEFFTEEDIEISAEMFSNMIHNMTGKKVDPKIFLKDNPTMDQLQEKFQEYLSDFEAGKKEQKKTKKQIEREEVEKEKNKLKGQSLRSVYVGLAKILHPDTETDPYVKAEKEEYMKRVTNAYEEKNLSDLLNLELQWVSSHTDSLANTPDETLKYFIMLLRDQVHEIEKEIFMSKLHPRYEKINALAGLSEKWADQKIEMIRRTLKKDNELLQNLSEELKTNPKSKEVLKKCVEIFQIDEKDYELEALEFMMRRF